MHLELCSGAAQDPAATRGAPSIGAADRHSRHHRRPKTAAGQGSPVDPLGVSVRRLKTMSGPSDKSHRLDHDHPLSRVVPARNGSAQSAGRTHGPTRGRKKGGRAVRAVARSRLNMGQISAHNRPIFLFFFHRRRKFYEEALVIMENYAKAPPPPEFSQMGP